MSSQDVKTHFKVTKADRVAHKSHEAGPSQRDTDKDLLRQFDLNWEFGPCSGISRLERWDRAAKFDKNPPQEIRDIILKHASDPEYTEGCWSGYEI